MSTWTFRLAPALLLAGCLSTGLGGGVDRVALTSDQLPVMAPPGFCVDPTETRDNGAAAFVLFGNCAAVTDQRLARQPQNHAILTAAISEPATEGGIAASMAGLPDFFRSADGAAVLSRSGDPDAVEVLQTFVAGDVFFLRASDSSPGAVPGVQDVYWRAYFDMGPRIATLSVLALEDTGTSEAAQLSLLETFVAQTRAAGASEGDAQAVAGTGLFNSGLFQRIVGPGRN